MNVSKNELYHHGILGQKWGIRRFQNKDGSLTAEGRARKQTENFKSIKKDYKKAGVSGSNPYSVGDNFKNKMLGMAKETVSKEDIDKLVSTKKKWLDLEHSTEEFADSKEAQEASNRAYQDTYKWFEKNNPTYLNEIIKNNNGSKSGLDAFHDFRKTNEGFEDEYWSKAEKEWNKTPKAKSRKVCDQAWEEYLNAQRSVVEKMIGSNKDIKVNSLEKYSPKYGDIVRFNVNWDEIEKIVK